MAITSDLAGRPRGRPASAFPDQPGRSLPTRVVRLTLELALAGLALGLLGAVLLARGVPMTGRLVLVVGGGSMEPSLHIGSAIVVEPVSIRSLAVGDVVTIEVGPDHAIFTHRITRVVDRPDGLWIETKGDANDSPDPSIIPATSVLGRVQAAVPGLGYVVAALSQPSGFGAALGLAGLLVALILLLDGGSQPESNVRRPDLRPESMSTGAPMRARPPARPAAGPGSGRRPSPRRIQGVGGS